VANTITADDLVAVGFLSMRLHWTTTLALLEQQREELELILRQIPTTVRLWDGAAKVEPALGLAGQAWELIRGVPRAGWVTAGKLLARKRPHLVPVYDRIIRDALGQPPQFWRPLREWICVDAHRERLSEVLAEARQQQPSVLDVPLLRVFDIVLWMSGRRNESAEEAEHTASVSEP